VTGLRISLTLLLLALWLPATSHALLESSGFIHQSESATDSDSDHDHDAADGICATASVTAPLVKAAPSPAVLYIIAFATFDISLSSTETHALSLSGLGPSPPLLPKSWQFVFRTALPGRAPSLAS
jgi:hypothetical protein